ncbi:MAG: IS200/IS605 family element transposase accessory protein TnpB, partial [Clostridiaceae bacterium]|nr:IS200/IS605 family element transposase accessory protein TnpB [Clostridiaceae bacterium]
MNKAYKFRIYPDAEQTTIIEKTFGCVRFVYNIFLNQRIEKYCNEKESIGYTKQQNQLPELKKELIWLKEVDSTSLQMSLRNLDRAFQNFFRDKSIGFPKFKSKRNNKKSYTSNYVNGNIEVKKNKVRLPKLGFVKASVHRYVEGKVINATINKNCSGKYFVSIITEFETEVYQESENKIGIDLGIIHFAVLSTGEKIDNPKYLSNTLKKLIKAQQKLSRKDKGSNNRNRQRIKVAKIHEKIACQREYFLHSQSKRLVDENQVICLEDLSIKNMMKSSLKTGTTLAQKIADVSWYKFYSQLEYKANWQNKKILKINRWY